MTMRKLPAGNAWQYLTKSVATGDAPGAPTPENGAETGYYTARGNPPGRWIGVGLGDLGLAVGDAVTEAQMRALYGQGRHPNAEQIIADFLAARVNDATGDDEYDQLTAEAAKATRLGRRYPVYTNMPFEQLLAERLTQLRTETGREPTAVEERSARRWAARQHRAPVAGFDLTATPPKSVSLLFGLADAPVAREVVAAHHAAVARMLAYLEANVAFTRTGAGGAAQIETTGLLATAFDHFDNREGEPNLHTHLVVANKVLGVDGRWRSLDARALHQHAVTASGVYDAALRSELTERLGLSWAIRPDTAEHTAPVWEIAGIDPSWIAHAATRRAQITENLAPRLAEFAAAHGHRPDAGAYRALAREANLATRKPKGEARPLSELRAAWRTDFTNAFGPAALDAINRLGRTPAPQRSSSVDLHRVAAAAIEQVSENRSTWTRANVEAAVLRALAHAGHLTHHERERALILATDMILGGAIALNAPAPAAAPPALRRSDGASVFTPHGATRYTTKAVLDAEQRLLDLATTPDCFAAPDPAQVDAALCAFEARHRALDAGQRDLARAFALDTRTLAIGIGPAGTGKTTAMRALAAALDATGRRLIPLATSGAAAKILGADLDRPAENLHKFLTEHTTGPRAAALATGAPLPPDAEPWRIRPGDVIVVDEAGMAGTTRLDALAQIAAHHGAALRLLGDHAQLAAVEAGGMLRLLASETEHVELDILHRFADPVEAAATLGLRDGDLAALDFYARNGRLHAGDREAMIDAVYSAWKFDRDRGARTLMIAVTNRDVADLAARARKDLVAEGIVTADGVELRDGNLAGTGDRIVTRKPDRRLRSTTGDFVRNGETWTVTAHRPDGALEVHREHGGDHLTLPAAYVAAHVEPAYSTTAHRAQGASVDTAHVLADGIFDRGALYSMATRAALRTDLYAVTPTEARPMDPVDAARAVLAAAIEHDGADQSATETLRGALNRAHSLAELLPQLGYTAAQLPSEQGAEPVPIHTALPWIRLAPAEPTAADSLIGQHLDALLDAVDTRVHALTATALADQPPWIQALRPVPTTSQAHEAWRGLISVIAAWRDAAAITEDDPCGPWVPRNDPEHAGYRAAHIAAQGARLIAAKEPRAHAEAVQAAAPTVVDLAFPAGAESAPPRRGWARSAAPEPPAHRRNHGFSR
ncbi:MobF family relaxase [Glycomyces sp. NPDC049804]|uniref:MobF family relaxase n=1 Tax=Glycomyces sp. NPDC049804 TaxID=3154363 RepID=UPI00343A0BF2